MFSEVLLQVVVAYLLDYVVIVAAFHYVEDPHDVFRLEELQNLDLGEECVLEVFVLVD